MKSVGNKIAVVNFGCRRNLSFGVVMVMGQPSFDIVRLVDD